MIGLQGWILNNSFSYYPRPVIFMLWECKPSLELHYNLFKSIIAFFANWLGATLLLA